MHLPDIRSRFGYFLYLILRNDQTWNRLRQKDKELVHEANRLHNNVRPDYAQPELYQGGKNFDSGDDRKETLEGDKLIDFLRRTKPATVIEIGPGSGFYSREIVVFSSVKHYVAIDIVQPFLDYLAERLKKLEKDKAGFAFQVSTRTSWTSNLIRSMQL